MTDNRIVVCGVNTASPITTEWLALPADIRSAAETAVGHLRPLTHAETLLIVGRAIKAERERCLDAVRRAPALDENGYIAEKGAVMNDIMRGDE